MDEPQFFIGIELQHAWRLYTVAVLDSKLKLTAMLHGKLPQILAFLGELDTGLIAINAPAQPNLGRMLREENRVGLFMPLPGNHSLDLRQSESEILLRGYPIQRTPSSPSACPAWMRRGFKLYRELKAMGFTPYSNDRAERTFLETSPEANFTSLLEREPFPTESIQGRIQRQLILWENRLPVRDPMIFFEEVTRHKLLHGIIPDQVLLSIAQLNAMIAAYTAYLAALHPDQVKSYGEAEEGLIYLSHRRKTEPSI